MITNPIASEFSSKSKPVTPASSLMQKIIAEIKRLEAMRDDVLTRYIVALDGFTAEKGSMSAIECVGILNDLDKHITNLYLEKKRLEEIHAQ